MEKNKILITGASGFIGSFLVEEAIEKGFEVWAGIRKTSSKRYLQHPEIHFIELDFRTDEAIQKQLRDFKEEHGNFEYIVHCAGVTKCIHKQEFDEVNFKQTCRFITAIQTLNMVPKQFAYISSLSIYGPVHEDNYQPIADGDEMCSNTAYAISKRKAEEYIRQLSDFPYVIYRPTGVYGPRETDYFLMAKSIRNHLDFAVGYKHQDLTFIYVKDVVQAVFAGIEKRVTKRAYILSDGKVYSSTTFSDLIRKELGNPWMLRLRSPLFFLKFVSYISEKIAGCLHHSSTLNCDKYKIMKQRNWRCDITPAIKELGYHPNYQLERGVKETIAWYLKEHWL